MKRVLKMPNKDIIFCQNKTTRHQPLTQIPHHPNFHLTHINLLQPNRSIQLGWPKHTLLHKLILHSQNQTCYHRFYPPQTYLSIVLLQPSSVTSVKMDCVITAIKNTALTIVVAVSFCFLWLLMMSNLILVRNYCHRIE